MDQIFCDASYKNGVCGVAAATPLTLWNKDKETRKKSVFHKISHLFQSAILGKEGYVVFFSAFPCAGSNEAEIKALGLAIAMAEDILLSESRNGRPVEISSDSLVALGDVLASEEPLFKESEVLRNRVATRKIILSKVKAHAGHQGNEIADEWSKKARRGLESSTEKEPDTHPEDRTPHSAGDTDKEDSICGFTARLLKETVFPAVITSDGRIVPRSLAFKSGDRNYTELFKERVWGGCWD